MIDDECVCSWLLYAWLVLRSCTRISVTTQLRNELEHSRKIVEACEEEQYVGAEAVIDEGQDPEYLAEPGKPPSKTPLCPTILQSMFCFQK